MSQATPGLVSIEAHQKVASTILLAKAQLEPLDDRLREAYSVGVTRPLQACLDYLEELRALLHHELLHEQPTLGPRTLRTLYGPPPLEGKRHGEEPTGR